MPAALSQRLFAASRADAAELLRRPGAQPEGLSRPFDFQEGTLGGSRAALAHALAGSRSIRVNGFVGEGANP